MMDEWRVMTEKFLRRASEQYFGLDFDQLTQAELIQDATLRRMLSTAMQLAVEGSAKGSLVLSAFALELAIRSCVYSHPFSVAGSEEAWADTGDPQIDQAINAVESGLLQTTLDVDALADWVEEIARWIGLLNRGINPIEYRRFSRLVPEVRVSFIRPFDFEWPEDLGIGEISPSKEDEKVNAVQGPGMEANRDGYSIGHELCWKGRKAEPEGARWAAQFAISTIVQLQGADPQPRLAIEYATFYDELISAPERLPSADEPI
jgi:hypothetical protein